MPLAIAYAAQEDAVPAVWSFEEGDFAEDELGLLLAIAPAVPDFEGCWQSWKADQPCLAPGVERYLDDLAGFAQVGH